MGSRVEQGNLVHRRLGLIACLENPILCNVKPHNDFPWRHASLCTRDSSEPTLLLRSYEKMFEEEGLLREWYRPHNERLYELLGHDFMWK